MKVITLNLKGSVRFVKILLSLTVIILIGSFVLNMTSHALRAGERYEDTVSKISEESIVVIDAGHGGEDCGAIGTSGIYEKDLNLEVAMTLGEMLGGAGYAVVYTRTEDKLLYTPEQNIKGMRKINDLKNRCKIAAEYPNSIFISIHMNYYGTEKYSGLQVYYSEKNSGSRELAQKIQSSVATHIQPDNKRAIKGGNDIYLLKNTDNVSVLIECGFLSNEEECKKLSEKEYQKELCFSILCGIIEYKENYLKDEDLK